MARLKVSVGSAVLSSLVARRRSTELCPAAMVTGPVTLLQCSPPSLDTSSVAAAAVSLPRLALPLASCGVKLMSSLDSLSRLTVNCALPPSISEGLETLRVGRSSSRAG